MGDDGARAASWGHTSAAATGARRSPPVPEGKRVRALGEADAAAYLERIRYHGSLKPDVETLRALHLAHLHAVPFENLDVPLREPSILTIDRLFDKIVNRRRGGVCHETNALFGSLLAALGFDVRLLSGGVYDPKTGLGRDFEHMLIQVDLERRWIADVGFGETFHEPLLLDEPAAQRDGGRTFFVRRGGIYRDLWMVPRGKPARPQYRFTLLPRSLEEYRTMCAARLWAPHSWFSRNLLCSVRTASGRVTVENDELIVTVNGKKQRRRLRSDEELRETLHRLLGIEVPRDRKLWFPRFRYQGENRNG